MGNLLFKRTNTHRGYRRVISPANTDLKYLSYSRLILDRELPEVTLDTGEEEWSLMCAGGSGEIEVSGASYKCAKHDSFYIPRRQKFTVRTSGFVDFVIASAPAERDTSFCAIPFAEVSGVHHGSTDNSTHRIIWTPIGDKVDACRLLCGFTEGDSGHWTSWPPHEHGSTREEIYVYELPAPGFGIQLVFNDIFHPEHMEVVTDGDAVVIPSGYHPNVAAPGTKMKFYWLMAGIRPDKDREWADVVVHPHYQGMKI